LVIELDDFENDFHVKSMFGGSYLGCVKYVHELQNLYFALTGEELELKNVTP